MFVVIFCSPNQSVKDFDDFLLNFNFNAMSRS